MSEPLPVIRDLLALGPVDEPQPPVPDWQAPLARLTETSGLSAFAADLLVLAALPNLHEGWGDWFAALGSAWRRPTLGLALRVAIPHPEQRLEVGPRVVAEPVFRAGLLRLGSRELPEPDRPLRPSAVAWAVLSGQEPTEIEAGSGVRQVDSSDGPRLLEARESLRALVEQIQDARVVHVGRGGRHRSVELAQALGARHGWPVSQVDAGDAPEVLQDAALLAAVGPRVVLVHLGAEVRQCVIAQPPRRGSLVVHGPGALIEGPGAGLLQVVDAPHPTPLEMAALWQSLDPALAEAEALDGLANQTRTTLQEMRRAVAVARGAGPVTVATVQRALADGRADPPSSLASIQRPRVPWDALVLEPHVLRQLEELRSRVAHRVTVQFRWGLSQATGRGDGVVAMLHGDSGVGKTFACEVLASALNLPLVKVDLSRVVSKYIGETEKNLESVFSMAEGFGYMLLFDEADAVFGKRTGVRDAHDRYANIETNYLLQRLEAFEGIAVLSTNLLKNVDEAFLRRLHAVIHLPRPNPRERRLLWERTLPEAVRGEDVDCEALARGFDLVGGEIRNASVRAAYLAAEAREPLGWAHLMDALRLELAKKGRPFPTGMLTPSTG